MNISLHKYGRHPGVSEPTLEPCPCCGHKAKYVRRETTSGKKAYVQCTKCGLRTNLLKNSESVSKWNIRIYREY